MEGDCNVHAHSSLWMRPTRPDRYNAKMVYTPTRSLWSSRVGKKRGRSNPKRFLSPAPSHHFQILSYLNTSRIKRTFIHSYNPSNPNWRKIIKKKIYGNYGNHSRHLSRPSTQLDHLFHRPSDRPRPRKAGGKRNSPFYFIWLILLTHVVIVICKTIRKSRPGVTTAINSQLHNHIFFL